MNKVRTVLIGEIHGIQYAHFLEDNIYPLLLEQAVNNDLFDVFEKKIEKLLENIGKIVSENVQNAIKSYKDDFDEILLCFEGFAPKFDFRTFLQKRAVLPWDKHAKKIIKDAKTRASGKEVSAIFLDKPFTLRLDFNAILNLQKNNLRKYFEKNRKIYLDIISNVRKNSGLDSRTKNERIANLKRVVSEIDRMIETENYSSKNPGFLNELLSLIYEPDIDFKEREEMWAQSILESLDTNKSTLVICIIGSGHLKTFPAMIDDKISPALKKVKLTMEGFSMDNTAPDITKRINNLINEMDKKLKESDKNLGVEHLKL